MALFGRKKGRHALGAAVTSIPSGPLRGAAPPGAPLPPAPAAAFVPPVVVPAAEPDLMTSIAELIATGEAWATEAPVQERPRVAQAAAAPVPPPAPPSPLRPALAAPTPVIPVVVPAPTPVPVARPAAVASAGTTREAALGDLLPVEASPPQPMTASPAAGRVQLGFRDGTSTTLDPGSSQALALEELAQTLTRRD